MRNIKIVRVDLEEKKTRQPKFKFTEQQTKALETLYDCDKYPSRLDKEKIGQINDIPYNKVNIWFQNRRAKEKADEDDAREALRKKEDVYDPYYFQ